MFSLLFVCLVSVSVKCLFVLTFTSFSVLLFLSVICVVFVICSPCVPFLLFSLHFQKLSRHARKPEKPSAHAADPFFVPSVWTFWRGSFCFADALACLLRCRFAALPLCCFAALRFPFLVGVLACLGLLSFTIGRTAAFRVSRQSCQKCCGARKDLHGARKAQGYGQTACVPQS